MIFQTKVLSFFDSSFIYREIKGPFQILVVDEVIRLCQNFQPLVMGNILKTQGRRPEDARLFDEDQKRIFIAIDTNVFRPKDMPIVAPNETGVPTISQLHFTEASRIMNIINEDVIGFDIYDAVRTSSYR